MSTLLESNYVVGELKFHIYDDDTAMCTGLKSGSEQLIITIPEKITYLEKDYEVTDIGDNAFKNESITEVILSGNIVRIGTMAFKSCLNLTKINLPQGLLYIDSSAFEDCCLIENISFPTTLLSIG